MNVETLIKHLQLLPPDAIVCSKEEDGTFREITEVGAVAEKQVEQEAQKTSTLGMRLEGFISFTDVFNTHPSPLYDISEWPYAQAGIGYSTS